MLLGVFIAFSGLVGAGITLHAQKGHHDITRTELEALFKQGRPDYPHWKRALTESLPMF